MESSFSSQMMSTACNQMSGFKQTESTGVYMAELLTRDHTALWEGPFPTEESATEYAQRIGMSSTEYIDYIIHQA